MNPRTLPLWLLVTLAMWITPASADPMSGYIERWDVSGDLAGWGPNTTITSTSVIDAGGNPNGYLLSSGDQTGLSPTFDIGAETSLPQVTGSYLGSLWQISFDLLLISGSFDQTWLRLNDGQNGWLYSLGADLTSTDWQSFSLILDPSWSDVEAMAAGWLSHPNVHFPAAIASNPWTDTLSNVGSVEIRISNVGFGEAGIDNFRLAAVPEPATLLLLLAGLLCFVVLRRMSESDTVARLNKSINVGL
jgi:PEP-CTERM motif